MTKRAGIFSLLTPRAGRLKISLKDLKTKKDPEKKKVLTAEINRNLAELALPLHSMQIIAKQFGIPLKKKTTIGVLPVGYYDGYSRNLSSLGEVLVNGKRCKVLGRLSMNLTVIDLSKTQNAKVWDEAVLIGKQGKSEITATEIADRIKTISYEVVSRINPLLPRIYKK